MLLAVFHRIMVLSESLESSQEAIVTLSYRFEQLLRFFRALQTSTGTIIRCITLKLTVFTRISAAALINFFAPQVQRLIESGAYLKIGRCKKIFSFKVMVYLPGVRKNYTK